ncbi:hemerythrin domain-containing protein [Psychroflexus lacisalsi]|jgi:hemerythrin-like domain-containing protein|uniref:Hemerythrin-like domain-containing protein n=1 Tax=Psychroflexus lacisalsi TaxID=503928 RepID=A0ABN1KDA6_9FLAO|nr:hemerythrin domain-containing protein [Psychroflexus lacisalsi]MBZ9620185.1 hemerythrin domain-containing protein [Psychroflexus lacisalsi]
MNNSPIKRHDALKNLSREHHDGLIFALRLQKGVAKKANLKSMEAYATWFWKHHLIPHFEMEEKYLFPKFGNEQLLVQKVKQQHRELKSLFEVESKSYEDIKAIYELLQKHIRLEERELFNLIQEQMNEKQLAEFQDIHDSQKACEVWPDKFWK